MIINVMFLFLSLVGMSLLAAKLNEDADVEHSFWKNYTFYSTIVLFVAAFVLVVAVFIRWAYIFVSDFTG